MNGNLFLAGLLGLAMCACGGGSSPSPAPTGGTGGIEATGGTGGTGGTPDEVPASCDESGCTCPVGMALTTTEKSANPTCSVQADTIEPDAAPLPPDADVPSPPDASPDDATPPADADTCPNYDGMQCAPQSNCTLRRFPTSPEHPCDYDCTAFGEPVGEGSWPDGASAQSVRQACNM